MAGKKNDTGKLRYDLIPPDVMAVLAHVYTMGADKYGDRNWEEGIDYGRLIAAKKRHFNDWEAGESLDPEDGQHHLASDIWCSIALLAYEMRNMGGEFDDRPAKLHTTRSYVEFLEECAKEDKR